MSGCAAECCVDRRLHRRAPQSTAERRQSALDVPPEATVVATTYCSCLKMPRQAFIDALEKHPEEPRWSGKKARPLFFYIFFVQCPMTPWSVFVPLPSQETRSEFALKWTVKNGPLALGWRMMTLFLSVVSTSMLVRRSDTISASWVLVGFSGVRSVTHHNVPKRVGQTSQFSWHDVFPQTVCPHWGVLISVKARVWFRVRSLGPCVWAAQARRKVLFWDLQMQFLCAGLCETLARGGAWRRCALVVVPCAFFEGAMAGTVLCGPWSSNSWQMQYFVDLSQLASEPPSTTITTHHHHHHSPSPSPSPSPLSPPSSPPSPLLTRSLDFLLRASGPQTHCLGSLAGTFF